MESHDMWSMYSKKKVITRLISKSGTICINFCTYCLIELLIIYAVQIIANFLVASQDYQYMSSATSNTYSFQDIN